MDGNHARLTQLSRATWQVINMNESLHLKFLEVEISAKLGVRAVQISVSMASSGKSAGLTNRESYFCL